jgi:hypothetical protein
MSEHTPGPWEVFVDDLGEQTIMGPPYPRQYIGSVDNRSHPTNAANATLIAAAPDLLEALEQTARVFESGAFIEEVVKPAIAKAKGEQP